jgi:hypothetical protein
LDKKYLTFFALFSIFNLVKLKKPKKGEKKMKKITKSRIEQLIELHEKMGNSYFWSPPAGAASRRSYELRYSDSENFTYDGYEYNISLETICSCKHIYYTGKIYVDGNRKDIRALKNLLSKLEKTNVG